MLLLMGRARIVALQVEDGCRTIDDGGKKPSSTMPIVEVDRHHGDTSRCPHHKLLQEIVVSFGEHCGRLGRGCKSYMAGSWDRIKWGRTQDGGAGTE